MGDSGELSPEMSANELPSLLMEMVRGNAPVRDLEAEGFTTWEIDAAKAIIRREASAPTSQLSRRVRARSAVTDAGT